MKLKLWKSTLKNLEAKRNDSIFLFVFEKEKIFSFLLWIVYFVWCVCRSFINSPLVNLKKRSVKSAQVFFLLLRENAYRTAFLAGKVHKKRTWKKCTTDFCLHANSTERISLFSAIRFDLIKILTTSCRFFYQTLGFSLLNKVLKRFSDIFTLFNGFWSIV